MKFGQLTLRKIIKTVANRCQILRLKCTQIDFGWGSAADPAGAAYSALQTGSWDKVDLPLKEREGVGKGREGKAKEGEKKGGRGGKGKQWRH